MSTALKITPSKPDVSRQRILQAFEHQAKAAGPRGVSMAALVSELGISTRTLYRLFPNKSALVTALMKSWASDWTELQGDNVKLSLPPAERIKTVALRWLDHRATYSALFWQQLKRDFPDAQRYYDREHQHFLQRSNDNLRPFIREELNPDLALSNLMTLFHQASEVSYYESFNLTRKDAVVQSIELWIRGALK
jgi:AcrR family transcriptional regulator